MSLRARRTSGDGRSPTASTEPACNAKATALAKASLHCRALRALDGAEDVPVVVRELLPGRYVLLGEDPDPVIAAGHENLGVAVRGRGVAQPPVEQQHLAGLGEDGGLLAEVEP